jgi:hypothetical protein
MAKKKPKGAGEWGPRKPFAAQIRGAPEWKQWLEEFAKYDRVSVSDLIDRALVAYARQSGFRKEPPPR